MFALRRRDANESEIVAALTAIGCFVTKLNDFGVCDLLVGYRSRTILIEVKEPDTHQNTARSVKGKRAKGNDGPPENAKGQLTKAQVEWWSNWIGGEAYVVETPEQAVALVRGEDLPSDLVVTNGNDEHGPIVALSNAATPDQPHTWMSPGQAIALAGALHEQAGVARARAAFEINNQPGTGTRS